MEMQNMKKIRTIETRNLCESAKNGGCGECQTSCQSASKTSCSVANQQCEKCKNYAANWQPTADEIWSHTKIRESRYENYKDWKPSQPIEK